MRKNITWSSITVTLALVLACATFVFAQGSESEHINRTLPLGAGGLVKVRNFSGHVTVSATDGADVVIEAVRRGSRSQLDGSRVDIRSEANTVVVEANSNASRWFSWGNHTLPDVDLDIRVPRSARLDVSVFSSPVELRGLAGDCRVHTFSAHVTTRDVTGALDAHTFSGRVSIGGQAWTGRPISVDTFSGNVDLTVPEAARGTVSFRSFSGKLNSERPIVIRERNRRSMTAELGTDSGASVQHGDVRLKTFSGNVRIGR